MRALVLTTLYPSPRAPHVAAFMPLRLAGLARHMELCLVVPYRVPSVVRLDPSAAASSSPFPVRHVGFPGLPGVFRGWRAKVIARAVAPEVARLAAAAPFDAVIGHFLYPDGVAAARIAAELHLPLVVVAHGSDVYQQAAVPVRRRQIEQALHQAAALIVVSRDLQDRLLEFGLPAEQAEVIPCGFDPQLFRPRDQAEARAELGLTGGPWLAYAGNLRDIKHVEVILAALAELPEARLAVVGDGPQASWLRHAARRSGVSPRVRWVGPVPRDTVATWLAAADVVVLASEHEGTPTVLIESMAIGRPVVATPVGGVPDLVGDLAPLVPVGDAPAMAAAIRATLAHPPDPDALRQRVAHLTFDQVAAADAAVLRRAVDDHASRRPPTDASY